MHMSMHVYAFLYVCMCVYSRLFIFFQQVLSHRRGTLYTLSLYIMAGWIRGIIQPLFGGAKTGLHVTILPLL